MLRNPFSLYIIAFAGVAAVYQLGWSDADPPVSAGLIVFFAITFVAAAALAWLTFAESRGAREHRALLGPAWIFPLVASMLADLIYSGGIPLMMVSEGTFRYPFDFGVPHLHVFAVTFGSAFSVIRFADYLATRRLRFLAEAATPVIYFIVIVYRGPATICLVNWAFVYLIMRRPGPGTLALMGIVAVIGLYLFGLFGDYRQRSAHEIVRVGRPSDAFRHSGVPTTFFWTYTYLTAPLANLELSVEAKDSGARPIQEFLVSEYLPDFLSKRILPALGSPGRLSTPEISYGLNVATMYGRSAVYAGWLGMAMMFAFFSAFVLAYLRQIRHGPFEVPALALLNTFVVFSTFQNMIAFSGVFLQLIWPLMLAPLVRLRAARPEGTG